MRIFVTGKIGSGKSTYASALAARLSGSGYSLFDVDALTKILAQDPRYQAAAMALFGSADRAEISKACFSDPAKLAAFERANTPLWAELLAQGMARRRVVVDFPLAIETQVGLPHADLAVGVSAPDDARRTRACARLGWDAERFDLVDSKQIGSRAKMAFCDIEAPNDGSAFDLEQKAALLARQVEALDAIEPECLALVGPLAWRAIARAHCQPHRKYHGGAHLRALVEAIDPRFRSDPACLLAILHHDFAYEVGSSYALNEAESCKALSAHARDFFPHLLAMPPQDEPGDFGAVALACALIDCTKGHAIKDPWILASPQRLARAQAFLDADLSILGGSSDEAFWAYDEAIGEEFSAVPRPLYHRLRAEAMAAFAAPERGPIYLGDLRRDWEPIAQARVSALVAKHSALAQDCAAEETP